VAIFIGLIFTIYFFFLHPPQDFPLKVFIDIPAGATVEETVNILEDQNVIKSAFMMNNIYRLGWLGTEDSHVIEGNYFFTKRLPLWKVIKRITIGDYGIDHLKVTIPEGLTLRQMANVLERNLPDFDRGRFLLLSKKDEGYLFPDTYYFSPNESEETIVTEMKRNFEEKINPLKSDIEVSAYSLNEIITMASIIEKEGITSDSRKVISGILWKRIEVGMKLQVDAVFPYIFGKNTFALTRTDLSFDSPYNTYRYAGLPPTPIASPSLDSITAALYPEPNDFWFYLSDYDSEMHYARTHDEHVVNRQRYLGK